MGYAKSICINTAHHIPQAKQQDEDLRIGLCLYAVQTDEAVSKRTHVAYIHRHFRE